MSVWRIVLFLQRHRTLGRLLVRGPIRSRLSRYVWADLESLPGFTEGIQRAEADFAAGRGVRYEVRDGEMFRGPR